MACRTKRGLVAFRPCHSAGFALLLFVVLSLYRLVARHFPFVNLMPHNSSDPRCRLWVVSGLSALYYLNGSLRVIAVIQSMIKFSISGAASGQKRTYTRLIIEWWLRTIDCRKSGRKLEN